jgi:hypothetical protein
LPLYKVTYKRLKPAGFVTFDPNQVFVETRDIPKDTPEVAAVYLREHEPYLTVVSVERTFETKGDQTQLSAKIENVSGIADTVIVQLGDFMQKNPYSPAEAKAILLKSQESFNEIKAVVDEVKQDVKRSRTMKSRIIDWLLGGVAGVLVAFLFQMLLNLLGLRLFS